MVTSWEDYLRVPPDEPRRHADDPQRYFGLAPLRDTLAAILESERPARVACLGAGVLNDIPYPAMVRAGSDITLVDWVPTLIRQGLPYAAIEQDTHGGPACAYCTLPEARALDYCRGFRQQVRAGVCAHYNPCGPERPGCAAYEPGRAPDVLGDDITAGYATAFARRVADLLGGAATWRAALRAARGAARATAREAQTAAPLPIADASIDLVTSSLVISQFEHEPYAYFSRAAAERLGAPSAQDRTQLAALSSAVRATLQRHQTERHFDEIARILKPGGVCFVAFELFQRTAPGEWFLVRAMHEAARLLGERFILDLDLIPEHRGLVRLGLGEQPSWVLCLALRPRAA